MNREERQRLIDTLQRENSETLLNMARRRAELPPEYFEPDLYRRDWMPTHRSQQQSAGPSIERRAVDRMIAEMHYATPQGQSDDYARSWTNFVHQCVGQCGYATVEATQDFIVKTIDMLAEEIGRIERGIRADLVKRQDDAIRLINERLDSIDTALADLASRLDEIEADTIDRSVTPLKGKRDAA